MQHSVLPCQRSFDSFVRLGIDPITGCCRRCYGKDLAAVSLFHGNKMEGRRGARQQEAARNGSPVCVHGRRCHRGGDHCSAGRGVRRSCCFVPNILLGRFCFSVLLLLVFGAVTVVSGYEKLPDRDPNRLTSLKKTFGDVVYGWVTNADGYPTQTESIEKYGPIEDWDVSQVTKMNQVFLAESSIFKKFKTFNADLSKWDTSRVTTMVGSKWNN